MFTEKEQKQQKKPTPSLLLMKRGRRSDQGQKSASCRYGRRNVWPPFSTHVVITQECLEPTWLFFFFFSILSFFFFSTATLPGRSFPTPPPLRTRTQPPHSPSPPLRGQASYRGRDKLPMHSGYRRRRSKTDREVRALETAFTSSHSLCLEIISAPS